MVIPINGPIEVNGLKVSNVGEKESEFEKRIGRVVPNGDFGFTLFIDESKMVREMALSTALCSYIDQWNTNLEVGGIYYGRQRDKYAGREID